MRSIVSVVPITLDSHAALIAPVVVRPSMLAVKPLYLDALFRQPAIWFVVYQDAWPFHVTWQTQPLQAAVLGLPLLYQLFNRPSPVVTHVSPTARVFHAVETGRLWVHDHLHVPSKRAIRGVEHVGR